MTAVAATAAADAAVAFAVAAAAVAAATIRLPARERGRPAVGDMAVHELAGVGREVLANLGLLLWLLLLRLLARAVPAVALVRMSVQHAARFELLPRGVLKVGVPDSAKRAVEVAWWCELLYISIHVKTSVQT